MQKHITKLLITCVAGLALLAGTGCMGYRLGSMLPPDIQTVAVPIFVNETTEPLLDTETTQAAIREIQKDGSLKIVERDVADVLLEVKLQKLSLVPLDYSERTQADVEEYRLRIRAYFQLTRMSTEEVMVADVVIGAADFVISGDLSSSKQTAIPDAAEELAHNIVEKIVEIW